MNWDVLWPVIGALIAAIVGSLITAGFLRRSSKETNDTNAFKVVTDQLFALNKEFRVEVDELKDKVKALEGTVTLQERELGILRSENGELRRKNRSLAEYVKLLLAAWVGTTPPPPPDDDLKWEQHL